jgi:hypothetical protein
MYEQIFYVVEGRGSTDVWLDSDSKPHTFEWQAGSLFSIPLNAWYQIVNAGSNPVLLLGGNTAPNMLNLINDVDAIYNCPYVFRDRFSGADDFYQPKDDIEPDPVRGLAMRRTNFIPDIVNCDLPLDNRRSPGYRRIQPFMRHKRQGFYRRRSGGKSRWLRHIRAGALPIESVELSRTVRLWGLNIFLAFRAGMTEWFSWWEEWEIRWPGKDAVDSGEICRSVIAA